MPFRPARPNRVENRARHGLGAALLIVSLGTGLAPARTEAASPLWRADFNRAQSEAQAANRPLWIQFSGPWCPACIQLERESLPNPRVLALAASSLVPVKLQTDVNEDLALRYGVTAIPTTIIATPKGEVIARQVGFLDGDGFANFLRTSLGRYSPPPPRPPAPIVRAARPAALEGHCPVSLVQDQRLTRGRADVALVYEGRVYRFANAGYRKQFQKHPERYVPRNGERCPVTEVDRGEARPGRPRTGALYQGHLYLFADAASRALFMKNPSRYLRLNLADRDARLVPGRPLLVTARSEGLGSRTPRVGRDDRTETAADTIWR